MGVDVNRWIIGVLVFFFLLFVVVVFQLDPDWSHPERGNISWENVPT